MSIFISYSHDDVAFVDQLVENLIVERHSVWLDRWELSLGDSLIEKIQGALAKASAVLVILSKASVDSSWCKQELEAAFTRQLAENKNIILPCVIDNCELPLFLRGKLYADFNRDPDSALDLVKRSLLKLINTQQSRIENPEFFSDWSVDFKISDGQLRFDWCFVDHNSTWPYVILTRCMFQCDIELTKRYHVAYSKGLAEVLVGETMREFLQQLSPVDLDVRISDPKEKIRLFQARFSDGGKADVVVGVRRLGEENGMDTLMRCHKAFSDASNHILSFEAAKNKSK